MSRALISILLNAVVRSLLLAVAAGLILNLFRVRNAGVKLAAWTTVLYGALLMPFAIAIAPPLNVISTTDVVQTTIVLPASSPVIPSYAEALSSPAAAPFNWMPAIATLYLLVAASLATRLAIGWNLTRRLRRAGRPLNDTELLQRVPGVTLLESDAISVPMCTGWRRPSILLPSSWRTWDTEKRNAVLAHELSHIERRDYATLLLAAVNRCVFWFSPLSWWLDRKLRDLSEQLSDDSVLRATGDSTRYAEIVLSFLEAMQQNGSRVRWQSVSMASSGRADRRIDRILTANRKLAAPLRRSMVFGLACAALPVLYLSAAVTSSERRTVAQPVYVRTPEEAAKPAPRALVAQAQRPSQPEPPKPPTPPTNSTDEIRSSQQDSYVIVQGNNVTMSGSREDLEQARSYRYKIGDDYIWFRRNGKAYIIRDKETVRAAKKLFEGQADLGKRQAALGEMQAKLGQLQAELGAQQNSVHSQMPDLTKEIESLKERLRHSASSEELGELQALLGDMQAKIASQQALIGDQQAKIGDQQASLGQRQAELGQQQAVLGQLQAEHSNQAMRELAVLIDEALKKGLAQPEPR